MKIIQFRVEEVEVVKAQLNFPDWEERLDRLGYIKEVSVGDNYEPIVFAQIFLAHRRSKHHKGITLITEQSSQWTLLSRVTDEALEFIGAMGDAVEMREGFVYFLNLAGEQGWDSLKDLRYKAKKLMEIYEAERAVDNDPNQTITDLLVEAFVQETLKRTGYAPGVKNAKDYIPFMEAAKLCHKYRVSPVHYISYLAEKWEWAGALKPNQLHGVKTEEYLRDLGLHPEGIPVNVKKVTLKKGADRYND